MVISGSNVFEKALPVRRKILQSLSEPWQRCFTVSLNDPALSSSDPSESSCREQLNEMAQSDNPLVQPQTAVLQPKLASERERVICRKPRPRRDASAARSQPPRCRRAANSGYAQARKEALRPMFGSLVKYARSDHTLPAAKCNT